MHKVLIVDDEPVVSLAIKSLINWEDYDISMEFEASNGKQALKILEENRDIEIVLTDINMPVMDGLELIIAIKEMKLFPCIIVLSAYKDYGLVRNAFKLGVNDYILKTELDADSLLKLLNSVISKIDKEKKSNLIIVNNKKSDSDMKIIKERVLKYLIEQKETEDSLRRFGDNNIRIDSNNIITCFLWVDDYSVIEERYKTTTLKPFISSVLNAIYQIINILNQGEAISLSPQEYVLFLSFPKTDLINIKDSTANVLKDIKQSLFNYVNINVSIGVSSIGYGYGDIRNLFLQAEKNARLRLVFGKRRVIYPEDAVCIENEKSQSIIEKAKEFILALKEENTEKTMTELDMLFGYIASFKNEKIETIYMYYTEIIFLIIQLINEMGGETAKVFGKEINFYEKITKFETCQEINIWIENMVVWVLEYIKDKKSSKVSYTIARALEFIRSNYHDENISIKMISSFVGLSENYFSVIFAKEVGEPFKDYIIRLRINKAKELMEQTNMKIYEICESIGYKNVEHFSRIFKKVTGHSPNCFKVNKC